MPRIQYQEFNFRTKTLILIDNCNTIIAEYMADGLKLTLRQLYYQLVSRDILPNNLKSYNMLGNAVSDARLAGLIDWAAIEDRTRSLESVSHWTSPQDILESCAASFRLEKWKDQPVRPEVWIEKEALAGVFERICTRLDVPYLSCRGYTSQSEMWSAAMRFVGYIKADKDVAIFHFGDHDPSGIDMTRDIEDRLRMFVANHVGERQANRLTIKRIALNMDQVEQYNPPENPAKVTDTRFAKYEDEFGDKSWELDALNPRILQRLVRTEIDAIRENDLYDEQVKQEAGHRADLQVLSDKWTDVEKHIAKKYKTDIADAFENFNDESKEEEEDA